MPYRVARVPGDSRRLLLHPERGLGTKLLVGLGAAASAVGVVLAMEHPAAGVVVALASSAFGGWVGTEAFVTRVEMLRDEREGRLLVKWRAVRDVREVAVPLEDLRSVLIEPSANGSAMRVVLELGTGERVALTPYQTGEAGLEELRRSVAELLLLGP